MGGLTALRGVVADLRALARALGPQHPDIEKGLLDLSAVVAQIADQWVPMAVVQDALDEHEAAVDWVALGGADRLKARIEEAWRQARTATGEQTIVVPARNLKSRRHTR